MRPSFRARIEKQFGAAAAAELDSFTATSRVRDTVEKEGGGIVCHAVFNPRQFATKEAVLGYCRKAGLDVAEVIEHATGNIGVITKGAAGHGVVGLTTVQLDEGVLALVANSRETLAKAALEGDHLTLIGARARAAVLKYGEGIEPFLWDESNNKERFDGRAYVNAAPGEREVIAEPAGELKDQPKASPGAAVAKGERAEVEKAGSGLMVALMLPPEVAARAALPGGEAAGQLHVTLGYLGKAANLPEDALERVREAVRGVCAAFGPIVGTLGGLGRFNASPQSDGKDVVYASFDAAVLPALRQAVVEAIDQTGLEVKKHHGYSPHVTLAYVDPADPLPVHRVETQALAVSAISLVSGSEREDIPLRGARVLKADTRPRAQQIRDFYVDGTPTVAQAAAGYDPKRRTAWAKVVPIVKMELAKKIVIGPVYVPYDPADPTTIDTQGHASSAAEIEDMAYRFMERHDSGQRIDLQHNKLFGGYARVVESYIAKAGDPLFAEGSWVMGVRILDDSVWQRILDGKITGFSLDGDTVLEEVPAAAKAS